MKQRIRLTEGELHRIIENSVRKVINEIGDTKRGSYMLGRAASRNSDIDDFSGLIAKSKSASDAGEFYKGYHDQHYYDNSARNMYDHDNSARNMYAHYGIDRFKDMDNLGKKFINFIRYYQGGRLMQLIDDYESENKSPVKELIHEYEKNGLRYKCTEEMIKELEFAYKEWRKYVKGEPNNYEAIYYNI